MLKANIKLALRNFRAHKFFAVLNIAGLALGMSACLTVILIIRDQLGFDHFHPAAGQTFRLLCQQETTSDQGAGKFATTPFPLGAVLASDFAVVEKNVRLVRGIEQEDATSSTGLMLPVSGYFTEPSFFEVFGFRLETGNAATALAEPNTLVLSKKAALRFFKNENPVGQMLKIGTRGAFQVTGVVANPPGKSHIGFDMLASVTTLAAAERKFGDELADMKILDNWQNRWTSLNYVVLRPGKTRADLDAALAELSENRSKINGLGNKIEFFAQNLSEITPSRENLSNEVGFGFPRIFLLVLGAFGVLLIVFPCLNYANLAIARAISRAKEVGIRKVNGAREGDLARLFLTEAVLTSFLALSAAWVLHHFINNFLEKQLAANVNLRGSEPISFSADWVSWTAFILFGLAVGLFAGWLPSRRLSKMRPASALRGEAGGKKMGKTRLDFRSVMTAGQFSVSLVFMIVVASLWAQLKYMTLANYGFHKENLLTLDLKNNKAAPLAAEIAQDRHVVGMCASTVVISGNTSMGDEIGRVRGGEKSEFEYVGADENYVPVMGLQLVAGENFPNTASRDHEQFILLNEKMVEKLALGTPAEAVGKTLWLNDSTPLAVCGVLRDFNFRVLATAIRPFAVRFQPNDCSFLQIRLAPGDPAPALANFESIWKKTDSVHPFEAVFMEEKMRRSYSDIEMLGTIIGFFAVLGLSLACLGLLGMVTLTVSARVKEIGVRKVVGASVGQIALLLSRRFLVLLGAAVAVAVPAGWFLSGLVLENFAYRISVGAVILGGSVAVLLVFGLATVGFQTVRAAVADPVKSLRSE